MQHVKGTLLKTRFEFLEEKCTPEQKEKVLAALSPELKKLVQIGVVPISWYPIDYYYEFLNVMDTQAGKGDGSLLFDLGKYTAYKSLRGIYKIFVKVGTPEFYIQRVHMVWDRLFDFGKMRAEVPEKGVCDLYLEGFDTMPIQFVQALHGWVEGTLEVCGAKTIKIKIVNTPTAQKPSLQMHGTWTM